MLQPSKKYFIKTLANAVFAERERERQRERVSSTNSYALALQPAKSFATKKLIFLIYRKPT